MTEIVDVGSNSTPIIDYAKGSIMKQDNELTFPLETDNNRGSEMAKISINYDEDENSVRIIGHSFRGEESLFASMNKTNHEYSDDEF